VRHGGLINADVVVIIESEEFLSRELHATVYDDGVWASKMVYDVEEELHSLLRFDHGNCLSLYPLCELVHGDK
jgi:hypothetical protein